MAAIPTETNLELDPEGLKVLGSMERATPGESLTGNPDEPKAWEQAPEFTNMREALDYIVDGLMKEDVFLSITGSIRKGIPISDVVQQILYVGFTEGKWNPDMMMLLIEPLMYVIMAFCEKAGVAFTLYRGEEEDDLADIDNITEQTGDEVKQLKDLTKKAPKISSVPSDILEKVEALEIPQESLMARPEQTLQDTNSLLAASR